MTRVDGPSLRARPSIVRLEAFTREIPPPIEPVKDGPMNKSNKSISRRQALKVAATLSTAGAIFPSIVRPGVVSGAGGTPPSETLNVAAIGTGMMGSFNTRNAARVGAKIVAICEADEARAARLYKEFPDARRYRDYRRMLEKDKGIDAVMIATPDHTHATIAIDAMELGKHIYCEKPLAHTMYEVRKMTDAARRHKVVTQMGNQGRSFHAIREFCDCIWSGAIGEVREVHCVQAAFGYSRIRHLSRIDEDHAVPRTLDWDLWLGTAPYRKYNPLYHPGSWRGWTQFGGGNMGDFVCHVVDPVFLALDLGAPVSAVAEAEGYDPGKHGETFPDSTKVRFQFPARGQRPPVTLYWYDGDRYHPPRPEEVKEGEESIPVPGWRPGKQVGALVVGDKGKIVYGSHGARDWRILPDAKMKEYMGDRKRVPEPKLPGPPSNLRHIREWLSACKGWKSTGSNFDYGGPLTEIAMLGNIAIRMLGTELQWDAGHMMFPRHPVANQYLHTRYREGWSL